ncbi:hypothetical protein, partial [Streptomyces sp. NPDC056690]|uniref:hypothetical protein n=1 Tax=Streptomyces sp. NPDC056690 TaxID=3345912 RepID=UPI0036A4F0F0
MARRFLSCRSESATEAKARAGVGETGKSSARSKAARPRRHGPGGTAPAARPRRHGPGGTAPAARPRRHG